VDTQYTDNCIKQTLLWMSGVSKHYNEECTIDFSCCYPELKMPNERRRLVGQEKLRYLIARRKDELEKENA